MAEAAAGLRVSAVADILRSYAGPGPVLRRRLTQAPSDARAVAWLMAAVVVIFVAQLPGLARDVRLAGGDPPFEALAAGRALGTLVFAPLLFYALAGVGRVVARLVRGRVSGLESRIALFWALLASAPLMLLRGVAAGVVGADATATILGALAGLAFLIFWMTGLREAARLRKGGTN